MNKDFNHSYWETKQYFGDKDLIVIGAGIVGLSTAISFKLKNKKANVLILERGLFPQGASTKNAGFACFGSASELIDDLVKMDNKEVWRTVKMRWEGLAILRKRLGDKNIDYKPYGGFELFLNKNKFEDTLLQLSQLNLLIKEHLGLKHCYSLSSKYKQTFKGINGMLFNQYEGQLDTGKMMNQLQKLALFLNVNILNSIEVTGIRDLNDKVEVESNFGVFRSKLLAVATNGFARELLALKQVKPARAQVLVTSALPHLKIKGAFHFDQGYYYFRNINNRILFGGGRNLDFKEEETSEFGLNKKIQSQLDKYLTEMILPGQNFKVEQRWSGIMGIGKEKAPIIEYVSKNVLAIVRMGGMGIAIGSKVGDLAVNKLI